MVALIFQYIAAHWIEWLFAAISGALFAAYRGLAKRLKTEACQFYISRGYCTVGDRDNLEYMFKPYKALGGNGTGEELYNRCLALEYGPAERED